MSKCITYKCALANTEHDLDSTGCTATKELDEEAIRVLGAVLADKDAAIKTLEQAHSLAIDREFKLLTRLDRALLWAWHYRKIARTNPTNYYTKEEIDHAKEIGDLQARLFSAFTEINTYLGLLEKVLIEVDEKLGVEAGDPLVAEIKEALDKPK